ncbi:MAG: hypothetical protein ACFFAY_09915, partial [Promethearchaeota archaeon]
PEDAPLGRYTAIISEAGGAWSVQISIVLEWAEFTILGLDVLNIGQLEVCATDLSVHNPLDSPAGGIVTVYIGEALVHREEKVWDPLISSQTVEFLSIYPPAGVQELTVTLHNPGAEHNIASLSAIVSYDIHWTFIALLTIIPFLGVTAFSTSFYARNANRKVSNLRSAYENEYSDQLEDALDFYLKQAMMSASTRVVSKMGFSEIALTKLNDTFGSRAHPVIRTRAAKLEASGELDTAARAYRILGDAWKALACEVLRDLKNGAVSDAASGFEELVSNHMQGNAMEVVEYLTSDSGNEVVMQFVKHGENAVLALAAQIGRDSESQSSSASQIVTLSQKSGNLGLELSVKVALGQTEGVIRMILDAKDVDRMIELTNSLSYDQKTAVAESVSRELKEEGNPESIASYLIGLSLKQFDIVRAAGPLIEALLASPGSRKLINALKSISKAVGPNGISEIDQVIDTANQISKIAKKKGVKPSDLDTFEVLELLPTIPNQEAIRPLLEAAEVGYWKGTLPENTEIGLLAEFTQRLREAIHANSLDVEHLLAQRLMNLEAILLNRLREQAVSQLQYASMKGIEDFEQQQSANEICNLLVSNLCVKNPAAAAKVLQTMLDGQPPAELRAYAERGTLTANPEEVLQKTLSPAEMMQLLQRHRVVRRRFDGTYVLEQDLIGATREVMGRVADHWTRKASDIWKSGLFDSLKRITIHSVSTGIPPKQKELIASYAIASICKHASTNPIENAGTYLKELMDSGLSLESAKAAVEKSSIPQNVQNRIKESLS